MKRVLSVWDFDGTLINSPGPDEGKLLYKKIKGFDFPHKGWWSKLESLDTEVFDIRPNPIVYDEYYKYLNDETYNVLLTGRMTNFNEIVLEILNHYELIFDEYHLNSGGSTKTFKLKVLDLLLHKMGSIEVVNLWDDREDMVEYFLEWGLNKIKTKRIKEFNFNFVSDNTINNIKYGGDFI